MLTMSMPMSEIDGCINAPIDGKAFLEYGGKIKMTQMTPDTAAAD